MKLLKQISAVVVVLAIFLLPACDASPSSSSDSQNPADDPLVGKWQMTRQSITPSIPAPNMVINQAIPESSTWTISRVNNQLTINYDGRETWYKTMGLDIDRKPVVVTETSTKTACTFKSGAGIQMDELPGSVSLVAPKKVGNASIDFDDEVKISLTPDGKLSAVIDVTGSGTYSSDEGTKTFSQSGTVTYQGIKK